MSESMILVCVLLCINVLVVHGQDISIYGKFELAVIPIDTREKGQIAAKCFAGYGFPTCRPQYQDDPFLKEKNLKYYNDMEDLYGALYCLQCCGTQQDQKDVWDLQCDLDIATATQSNIYGRELRLAAKQDATDEDVIRCPLMRSACDYEANGLDMVGGVCTRQASDTTFLVGYTLTIIVQQYNQNFVYWNGIKSCSIVAEESATRLVAGDKFRETIILVHDGNEFLWDIFKPLIACIAIFVCVYATLYYCRRKHCNYCLKKLIFSRDMCYVCKFVGAEPPDPVLMRALEEKSEHMQGEPPERFPGSRKFVAFVKDKYGKAKTMLRVLRPRSARVDHTDYYDDDDDHDEESRSSGGGKGTSVKPSGKGKGKEDIASPTTDKDEGGNDVLQDIEGDDAFGEEKKEEGQGEGGDTNADKDKDKDKASENLKPKYVPPLLDFFPFRWKYPKFLVRHLGFSNKRSIKQPSVNPNLLDYPEHIIFAAVGHHDPPTPDKEAQAAKLAQFEDNIGYVPEAVENEFKKKDEEEGEKEIPEWQKEMKVVPKKMPKEEANKKVVSISDLRNAFKKTANKGNPMPKRICVQMTVCLCCIFVFALIFVVFGFNIIDTSGYY